MSEFLALHDIICRMRAAQAPRDVWKLVVDSFHARGIEKISYHRYQTPLTSDDETSSIRVIADGFSSDWVCHYIEAKLFLVDPIPGYARLAATPFFWSDIPKLTRIGEVENAYLKEMEEANLGDGIAFQVFGPAMNNAYVGLGFAQGTPRPSPTEIAELQCIAQTAHIRVCELQLMDFETRFELSRRELEILRWIARGKSNSVIADILEVSHHTVDTHVRRVFDKLGVTDRTSAALRGVGSGLILPP
ncbi:helix-turn-helix transcriptional regulator [Marivita hallyeonensis]|uniref:LuxR family transcriptional regulator/LuxR family transcriptional regulator, quorum-sensing system regulator CciR n=1 Tax=Marivita hallyeonensis TaxID=996342 RepID=A0A1M5RCD9_9RHOB|nr:LuxR family transcriptional regulator [Marivita hallyeonensis]SHH24007.1 LuxR family transcriptional regulator/LuxR family transcriptional regulator, quorum-sensing system regulator CciR [Marivita hallyeonensis]